MGPITAKAINTKVGRDTVNSRPASYGDPAVNKSKVTVRVRTGKMSGMHIHHCTLMTISPALSHHTPVTSALSPVAHLDAVSFLLLITFFLLLCSLLLRLFFRGNVLEPTQFQVLFECT